MSELQINNGAEPVGKVYYDAPSNSLRIEGLNGKTVTIASGNAASWAPPVGATYIQFPTCVDPGTLWVGTTWQKLFDDEGVFFRTEGGYATAFGAGVQSSANLQHNHYYVGYAALGYSEGRGSYPAQYSTAAAYTGNSGTTEARSTNRTIRVWRRTA